MKHILLALAILLLPLSPLAKNDPRTPPGPQPSVTIRDLPAPAKKGQTTVREKNPVHRNMQERKQVRKQIARLRKQIVTLNQQMAKTDDKHARLRLKAQVDMLRHQIVWLQTRLFHLRTHRHRHPWLGRN